MYEVYRVSLAFKKEVVFVGPLKASQEKYRQIIRSGLLATIVPVR
jgi:hypothetical protein